MKAIERLRELCGTRPTLASEEDEVLSALPLLLDLAEAVDRDVETTVERDRLVTHAEWAVNRERVRACLAALRAWGER